MSFVVGINIVAWMHNTKSSISKRAVSCHALSLPSNILCELDNPFFFRSQSLWCSLFRLFQLVLTITTSDSLPTLHGLSYMRLGVVCEGRMSIRKRRVCREGRCNFA